jgi:hypothetical protein
MLGLENGLESFECCWAQFVVIILELLQPKRERTGKRVQLA